MTVKELRDRLDNYIKHDSPDTWQLNDVEADAQAYKERCKDRENQQIIILDDGMKPRYFAAEAAFGVPIGFPSKITVVAPLNKGPYTINI